MRNTRISKTKSSPLTLEQKNTVLRAVLRTLHSEESYDTVIIDLLYEEIENNNHVGYPELLATMIQNLYAPFCHLSGKKLINNYRDIIKQQLKKTAMSDLIQACKNAEQWGSIKIHLLAQKLNIPVQAEATVCLTIEKGKVLWDLFSKGVPTNQHQHQLNGNHDNVVEMTFDDFCTFKDGGKRKQKVATDYRYKDENNKIKKLSRQRPNRDPKSTHYNYDHTNKTLCHICVWDVSEYSLLKRHRHKIPKTQQSNYECCGQDYPLELDHIPASSLLKMMQKTYVSINSALQSENGYVIAVPEKLHQHISASYKNKAKQRDTKKEAEKPSTAIYTDIEAYLIHLHETKQLSLKILGAFRYLYRLNVKRLNKNSDESIDQLFLDYLTILLHNNLNMASSKQPSSSAFNSNHPEDWSDYSDESQESEGQSYEPESEEETESEESSELVKVAYFRNK